ncbi:hypothetical protein JXL19_02015 [bacterium]|nr:hypothetical protein [bacterium]
MNRSPIYKTLRVVIIIIFLLLLGSLIIYFIPETFSQIHHGNFNAWLIMNLRRINLVTFWILLLIPLIIFLAISILRCLFTRTGYGKKRAVSSLFHIGFLLAIIGFCLDCTFGVRGVELSIRSGEQTEIPGFSGLSIKMADGIDPVTACKGKSGFFEAPQAILELLKGDRMLKRITAGPNRPLLYRGKAVYLIQSGKRWTGVRLRIEDRVIEIRQGEIMPLLNQPYKIRMDRTVPHLGIDKEGNIFSQSQGMMNPAAQISLIPVSEADQIMTGWLFQKFSHMNPLSKKGIHVEWLSNLMEDETVVHFGNHPGLGLVLAGMFLALIGTIFMLYGHVIYQKQATPLE